MAHERGYAEKGILLWLNDRQALAGLSRENRRVAATALGPGAHRDVHAQPVSVLEYRAGKLGPATPHAGCGDPHTTPHSRSKQRSS